MTENTSQTTLVAKQFKTTTQHETIGGHPVLRTTDVDDDDVVVCVECGNATLAESDYKLANEPCENDGFLPHPAADK